jgi:hypothetical protein
VISRPVLTLVYKCHGGGVMFVVDRRDVMKIREFIRRILGGDSVPERGARATIPFDWEPAGPMAARPNSLPGQGADVPFVCPGCRALWMVRRQHASEGMLLCLACNSLLDSESADAGQQVSPKLIDAVHARTARIRLHWFAGFVSEYPDPTDEDTQAVSLNLGTGLITLHAATGQVHRFEDANVKDADGFATFREHPTWVQVQHRPATSSGPGLPAEECFDYVAVVPAPDDEQRWRARPRDDDGPSTNRRQLVGRSPHVRIESVGAMKGGGPLSPLCDLVRPAVLGARVVLTASDRTEATAQAVWFHLDQGLVSALRPGDVINLTRSPRGGLALSVVRGNALVVAIGAVTAVPLAPDLKATVRRDQVVGHSSDGGFETGCRWLHPVHITTAEAVPRKPKGFTIRTWYGAWPVPQDSDECVSIVRHGRFPELATFASTHLLATSDALHVQR